MKTRELIDQLPHCYTVKVKAPMEHVPSASAYVSTVATSMLAAVAQVCKALNVSETAVEEVTQVHRGVK